MVRVMPRPFSAKALGYIATVIKKAREAKRHPRAWPPSSSTRSRPSTPTGTTIPRDQRHDPGEDAKFDEKFSAWLRDSSAWVPLKVLLKAKPDDLVAAGYPEAEVKAFLDGLPRARAGRGPLRRARSPSRGRIGHAGQLAEAGRGREPEQVSRRSAMIERETHFNAMNPFWQAPFAYGAALVAAGREPGLRGRAGNRSIGRLGQGVYLAGHARARRRASPWRSTASPCGSGSRAGRR